MDSNQNDKEEIIAKINAKRTNNFFANYWRGLISLGKSFWLIHVPWNVFSRAMVDAMVEKNQIQSRYNRANILFSSNYIYNSGVMAISTKQ